MTDHAHEYHDGRCIICYEAETTVGASVLADGPTVLVIAGGRSWTLLATDAGTVTDV